jgi:lysophospholipase L1-like esterase
MVVAALVTLAGVPAGAVARVDSAPYYLALGDSLSQGVQPNAAGKSVPTNQGYADDLWSRYHAAFPALRLEKMGCPGETTGSMINGGVCPYSLTSQLNQAVDFLSNHRVRFVTIDIGANNIDGCVSGSGLNMTCLAAGEATAQSDLPVILAALHRAAPGVPVIAMNYYDPFVAAALKGGSFVGLAVQSEALGAAFNRMLGGIYRTFGVAVADVQGAFAPVNLPSLPYLDLPLDLASVCALTWMCAPAPIGPNIHATAAGYTLIAQVFAEKIG